MRDCRCDKHNNKNEKNIPNEKINLSLRRRPKRPPPPPPTEQDWRDKNVQMLSTVSLGRITSRAIHDHFRITFQMPRGPVLGLHRGEVLLRREHRWVRLSYRPLDSCANYLVVECWAPSCASENSKISKQARAETLSDLMNSLANCLSQQFH